MWIPSKCLVTEGAGVAVRAPSNCPCLLDILAAFADASVITKQTHISFWACWGKCTLTGVNLSLKGIDKYNGKEKGIANRPHLGSSSGKTGQHSCGWNPSWEGDVEGCTNPENQVTETGWPGVSRAVWLNPGAVLCQPGLSHNTGTFSDAAFLL